MRELISTVTAKGQITIPVEIRRLLKFKSHDKIAFILEGDHVRLTRKGSVVDRTAGSLRPPVRHSRLRNCRRRRGRLNQIVSFDRGFDRVPGIKRMEP